MTEDYYQTLELPRTASLTQIKHAYRRLARKYHPDFNPGDAAAEDRMEDINRAYEVLSDKTRREEYDRYQRVDSRAPAREEPKQKTTFEEARQQANVYDRLTPYEILGVSPRATYREVREAFAEFVRIYGDALLSDPSAALAYQHVKAAYDLLSHYERRRRYNAEHGLPDPPCPTTRR